MTPNQIKRVLDRLANDQYNISYAYLDSWEQSDIIKQLNTILKNTDLRNKWIENIKFA